jgi:hypothetical protein
MYQMFHFQVIFESISMGQAPAKCIMCGKDIAISDRPDDKSESEASSRIRSIRRQMGRQTEYGME